MKKPKKKSEKFKLGVHSIDDDNAPLPPLTRKGFKNAMKIADLLGESVFKKANGLNQRKRSENIYAKQSRSNSDGLSPSQ
jgi:hypothetical protein